MAIGDVITNIQGGKGDSLRNARIMGDNLLVDLVTTNAVTKAETVVTLNAGEARGPQGLPAAEGLSTGAAFKSHVELPGPGRSALESFVDEKDIPGSIARDIARPYSTLGSEVLARGQSFARQASRSAAPDITSLRLHTSMQIANSTIVVLNWLTETVDTLSTHTNGAGVSSRIIVPAGAEGFWRFSASITWPPSSQGSRTIWVRQNGSNVARLGPVASIANEVTQNFTTPSIFAQPGDYFEVAVMQNSGADVTIPTLYAFFEGEFLGPAVGQQQERGMSFDASMPLTGTRYYRNQSATINPHRMFLVPDPTGRDRHVTLFSCRETDNNVLYPRVQAATPSGYGEGADIWIGFGVYVPEEYDAGGAGDHVMLHEMYGPPFSGAGPNALRLFGNDFTLHTQASGNSLGAATWTMPIERGTWFSFALHYKMSSDPAVGFVELWLNSGAGWAQQLVAGELKHFYATLGSANGNGNNYSTIKVSYAKTSARELVEVLFSNHRAGTSRAMVDPGDY